MNKVERTLRDVSLERGRRNEQRFFDAMNEDSQARRDELPKWIRFALRPTSSQDRFEGIDAIIKTADVGNLYVQIKSSQAGKKRFEAGRHFQRNKSIVVIVIQDNDTPSDIRSKARKLLSKLRQAFLAERSCICHKQGR